MKKGIGGHHRSKGCDEWLTPPFIIKAVGPFDLDPCSPVNRPWDTASEHYTIEQDGLLLPWRDMVWLNPPYGNVTCHWLQRLAEHGQGIALVFARTETKMFHKWVWPRASAMLFLRGRIHFHHIDGSKAKGNAGGPSVLISYGNVAAERLRAATRLGHYIQL